MAERQSRLGDAAATAPVFTITDGRVAHPYLVPGIVEAREYQVNLARDALRRNSLVVLPTGLGKTIIAVLVMAELLREKRGRVLVLAPTRPLSLQHADTFRRMLRDGALVNHLSGELAPEKRAQVWKESLVIVATPQTVRNDLAEKRYSLADVGLVVFDEAHRGVGEYAYGDVADELLRANPRARVLALTASPGAKKERIEEVRSRLGVELVVARDQSSDDVAPYVYAVEPEKVFVDLTPVMRSIQQEFQAYLNEQEAKLRQYQVVHGERSFGVTKRELVGLIQSRGRGRGGGPGPPNFAVLQVAQKALYATICLEHLETQGLVPLKKYLDRMAAKEDLKRAEKAFFQDERVQHVWTRLTKGIEKSHPKVDAMLAAVREQLARRPGSKVIVFAQYRDTVEAIAGDLAAAGLACERLVGQQSKAAAKGQTQTEQADVLRRFGEGAFPVLVSTSIGEEGLDVPQVDLVVFYEAIPSEIRAVQRRGRTGRTFAGRVVVLIARGTRDEAFLNAQESRERKMRRLVGRMR